LVRLEQVSSLRPLVEARNAEITRRAERNRGRTGPPRPAPDLPPAEGVAALRALADFTLAASRVAQAGYRAESHPGHGREWAARHRALWRRAVAERRRLAGEDEQAADDVVTSAVNHLGNLASNAAWFTADERLREAAIDETLRRAMLDERVPSDRAQYLWARYWVSRMTGPGPDLGPDEVIARIATRERMEGDLMAAWDAWAARA
jgi:hypothetical protein